MIENGNIPKYKDFISRFPKSKHITVIKDDIYKQAMTKSFEYCYAFAELFPEDIRIKDIITLCIVMAKDDSIKKCKEVIDKFEDYPLIDELKNYVSDYEDKMNLKLFKIILDGSCEVTKKVIVPSGEYLIERTLIILGSGSLEINPGTTLKFAEEAGLDVYGKLKAIGTKEQKITFTAQTVDEGWRNIAFYDQSKDDSCLKYCLIEHGTGISDSGSNFGGGIYITNSTLSIERCKIANNSADSGGGIFIYKSSVSIINSYVEENKAELDGGGIVCVYESKLTITKTEIAENESKRLGGGVCIQRANGIFEKTEFINNKAGSSGGGLQAGSVYLTLTECTFEKNSAMNGGGIHIFESSDSRFTECEITNNKASESGGGIYIQSGKVRLSDCEIENNNAVSSGGGIFVKSGDVNDLSSRYKNNKPDNKSD